MATVSQAVGQFAGVIRELLGLTHHSRLRHQIDDTLDLFAKAKPHPELGKTTVFLAATVEEQSRRLLVSLLPSRKRKWDWSTFSGGVVVVAIAGALDAILWQFEEHLWALIPFYVVAILGGLFLLIALLALFGREPEAPGATDADPATLPTPPA